MQRKILVERRSLKQDVLDVLARRIGFKGKTVVDIGANIGSHSLYISIIGEAKMVYAFEPQPIVRNMLETNVELNNVSNIKVSGSAIGSESSRVRIDKQDPRFTSSTTFIDDPSGVFEINTLDSFKIDYDFLKIDAEYHSFPALRGSTETMKRCRPAVLVELDRSVKAEGAEFMRNLGYQDVTYYHKNNYLFTQSL